MKRRTIILDGSRTVGEAIRNHLSEIAGWDEGVVLDSAHRLAEIFRQAHFDLMIVDIDTIRPESIREIEKEQSLPLILAVAGSAGSAMAAFEIGAIGFLLKPFSFARLQAAIRKAENFLSPNSTPVSDLPPPTSERAYFFVKSDYKILKVNLDDIQFIQGMREYVRIHTDKEKIVTLQSLNRMEEILPPDKFVRIHRSYIVNVDKIHFIQGNVLSIGDSQLNISKRRREEFLNMLNREGLF